HPGTPRRARTSCSPGTRRVAHARPTARALTKPRRDPSLTPKNGHDHAERLHVVARAGTHRLSLAYRPQSGVAPSISLKPYRLARSQVLVTVPVSVILSGSAARCATARPM